jgi:hypothetical protein
MTAHAQALLIQTAAFVLASIIDVGWDIQMGVWVSCLLFWVAFFLLYLSHRCHVTRLDLFFLRLGSVPFLLFGTLILWPLVESTLLVTLRPAE